ncbi:NlpC/P60 family protein [Aureimonas sp. SK2]|uniref:NlpC/P60 family protein n=1 Tax=Aureimonas sp. SK2 TaxID=3015992 RepID=UPI002443EA22|nr:NlpC/P60 family protein [Aureimonas sp. SK2]
MSARERALAAARGFLGTPYRHQGHRRGVGCDCLGLVRGVWRELYGRGPEAPGPYSPDWAETGDGDPLMEAARRHFRTVPMGGGLAGDVVLFCWRNAGPARHCGILDEADAAGPRLIHAYEGTSVVSSPLTPGWAGRIAGTFRFPDEV